MLSHAITVKSAKRTPLARVRSLAAFEDVSGHVEEDGLIVVELRLESDADECIVLSAGSGGGNTKIDAAIVK